MVTPSGQISIGEINIEIGSPAGTSRSLNDANVRALAVIPTGAITMTNLQNKRSIESTGGTKSFASGYVRHSFSTSGNFSITKNARVGPVTMEYNLLGGGGGGGVGNNRAGGGGGGGGVLSGTYILPTGTLLPSIAVTVGGGGSGATPAPGSNSSIAWPTGTITAGGGGRGGGPPALVNGANGNPASPTFGCGGGGKDGASGGTGGPAGGSGINPGSCPGSFGGGGGGGAGGAGASAGPAGAGGGGGAAAFIYVSPTLAYGYGGGGGAQRGPAGPATFSAGTDGRPSPSGGLSTPTIGPTAGFSAPVNSEGGGGGGGSQLWPAPCVAPATVANGGNGGIGGGFIRYVGS